MARRFAKVSEEEICEKFQKFAKVSEEAFFYPSGLVNTKKNFPPQGR